jgi:hypothetical protein
VNWGPIENIFVIRNWPRPALYTLGIVMTMIVAAMAALPVSSDHSPTATQTTRATRTATATTSSTRATTTTRAATQTTRATPTSTTTTRRTPTNPRQSPTSTASGFVAAWLAGHDTDNTSAWARNVQTWTTTEYGRWIPVTNTQAIPDTSVTRVALTEQGENDAYVTVTLADHTQLAVTLAWDGTRWDVSNSEPA